MTTTDALLVVGYGLAIMLYAMWTLFRTPHWLLNWAGWSAVAGVGMGVTLFRSGWTPAGAFAAAIFGGPALAGGVMLASWLRSWPPALGRDETGRRPDGDPD